MIAIDKDNLIDDLLSLSSDVGKMGFEWLARDDVMDAVRWQDEYELDEWFDVRDDLPECRDEDVEYMVTINRDGVSYVTTSIWRLFSEKWMWNDDGVIAWRYMPEPYRRGEHE